MAEAPQAFVPGEPYWGFRFDRAELLPALRAEARMFEHVRSGRLATSRELIDLSLAATDLIRVMLATPDEASPRRRTTRGCRTSWSTPFWAAPASTPSASPSSKWSR